MSKNGSGEKGHETATLQETAVLWTRARRSEQREKWMETMHIVELMSEDLWMDWNRAGMRKGRDQNG